MAPSRYSVLAAIMVGGIMGPIDASIVNIILPTITQYFNVDIPTAQWVPMIYLLTISSLLLFYGRLGDILGYKKVYLFGLLGFIISSGLCGFSPTVQWLIVFRLLQGLTAGMMMAMPYAIITSIFPPSERGKALGINAISISAGLAIGPSLGGFIAAWNWRFVFLINIPIGIAAFIWGRMVIPEREGQRERPVGDSRGMDVWGALTAFVFLFSALLFVNRLPRAGLNCTTGAMLLAAIVAGIAFLRVERGILASNGPIQPLLDLRLFRNTVFSFANLSAFLNFMSQYVMVFLTPFYLQRVLRLAPNQVGLIMTSFPLAVMIVAPFSGSLSDRAGTRTLASLGAGICAISLFFMSRLSGLSEGAGAMAYALTGVAWRLALFGLGTGVFQSPNNSAVMGSAPRAHLGVASGILATMRNAGMTLGIATGGAVLNAIIPPHILQKAVLEGSEIGAFLPGLKYAYVIGGILSAIASLTSLAGDTEAAQRIRQF